MQNIELINLEENIIARLDHDPVRVRWVFRLIDTDAGETITTRIYNNLADAIAYMKTWRDPFVPMICL